MRTSRKKVCLSLAVFSAVFLFGLTDYISNCRASVINPEAGTAYQTKAKNIKLKISVKKKTKKSSIKLTGKTSAYFTVIISVNGQEKTTLTANKKGAFKFNVPLDSAVNTVSVRATNGTVAQSVSKIVKSTWKFPVESYKYHEYYPIILSVSDNKGNIFKFSQYNYYSCSNCSSSLGNYDIREGDTIDVRANALDPNNKKLLYNIYMGYTGNCGNRNEWTESNEFTCTLSKEDISSSGETMRLFVYIKSEKEYYRNGAWPASDDSLIFDYNVKR
jgi:hypothetical protein